MAQGSPQAGLPKAVFTDNGSENLGAFAELLKTQQVPHYFARPYTPRDKPPVERFIGSFERECLQWGGIVLDVAYRLHQALGYLTPDEFAATLRREEVALM